MLLRFDVYKGFSKDVNCFPKPNYWLLQSKFIEKTLPFTVEPVVMTYRQFAIVSIVLKQISWWTCMQAKHYVIYLLPTLYKMFKNY